MLEKLLEVGPEGTWRVYLTEKGGGEHTRDFESRRKANHYLRRRHDSVVSYKAYLVEDDGAETFIREGRFKPRSDEWHRRDKARLRRKQRARRRAREAAKLEALAQRPTRW
jgi:hypothetical protein